MRYTKFLIHLYAEQFPVFNFSLSLSLSFSLSLSLSVSLSLQGALGLDENEFEEDEDDEYEIEYEDMILREDETEVFDPHSRKFKPDGQLMT